MISPVLKLTAGRIPFKWSPEDIRHWLNEGAVIFVALDTDWLDLMVLNHHLKRAGLPVVQWTNTLPGIVSLGPLRGLVRAIKLLVWFLSFKSFRAPVKTRQDEWLEALQARKPVLLSFPENERRPLRRGPPSEQWLAQLLAAGHESKFKVRLVPFYLFWKRSSISKRRTLWSILVGSPHDPRPWRKLLQFVRPLPSFSFATLEAHTLEPGIDLHNNELPILARQWRRRCIIDLVAARRVLLGPAERSESYLLDHLLSDSAFEGRLQTLAAAQGVPPGEVPSRVQKDFREIAARFNFFVLEIVSTFCQWLWHLLYTKVDIVESELDSLSRLNQQGSLILVPCHKSHIDYVILSDQLFRHGIVPPHIAAGINLAFWPFGRFARWCGAFFIRRSFKGDQIYGEVLRQYIASLLRDRYNIEFFIEGGRSRTGRMLPPRYGLLKMVMSVFEEQTLKDAFIIPVFIEYDLILEAGSYRKEMAGAEKKSESPLDLVRSTRFLLRKYGKIYVRFGEPITVSSLLPPAGTTLDAQPFVVEKAAFQIARAIQKEGILTPSALLAFTYLTSGWDDVHQERWINDALSLMIYFKAAGAEIEEDLITEPRRRLEKTLGGFVRSRLVTSSSKARSILSVPTKKRVVLNIYRNHLVHWALLDASALIIEKLAPQDPFHALLELRSFLKFEFFLPPTAAWEKAWEKQEWKILDERTRTSVVRSYADLLEAYGIGVASLLKTRRMTGFFAEEFLKSCRQEVALGLRFQRLIFPECAIVGNFKTCLKWLVQEGALAQDDRKGRAVYAVKDETRLQELGVFLDEILGAIRPQKGQTTSS